MRVDEFIEGFAKGTLSPRKHKEGQWKIESGDNGISMMVYYPTGEDVREGTDREILALKYADGVTVYNANRFEYIGSYMAWGRRHRHWGQHTYQRDMERAGAIGIPFTIFTEADISPLDLKVIVKPTGERINVRTKKTRRVTSDDGRLGMYEEYYEDVPTHFIGASVFTAGGKYFLFDADRIEINNGRINPFITELAHPVESIDEAYDSLIPSEVYAARDEGTEVLRQGEYFFIKHDGEPNKYNITKEDMEVVKYVPSKFGFGAEKSYSSYRDKDRYYPNEMTNATPEMIAFQKAITKYDNIMSKIATSIPKSGSLGNGGSGSHQADKTITGDDGSLYASGNIHHSRREHEDLILDGWYKVVKNLAVRSVQINGDVD